MAMNGNGYKASGREQFGRNRAVGIGHVSLLRVGSLRWARGECRSRGRGARRGRGADAYSYVAPLGTPAAFVTACQRDATGWR